MTAMCTQRANMLPLPGGERVGVRGWAGHVLHFIKGPFVPISRKNTALRHAGPSPQPSPRRGEGVTSLL